MRQGDECSDATRMVEEFVLYLESISQMDELKLPNEFDIAKERLANIIENGRLFFTNFSLKILLRTKSEA